MYLDTNECFKNTGKINSTRFGDFYVMASKGDIQEKKHYLDELQYIVNRCRDILNNNGSIEIFKEYCFNKDIIIADKDTFDVQDLLIRSQILITDYSSVFFDFAYMKKPEIFFQFDNERYRNSHYKEGYFSYELDGFGKVTYNRDE